jgi:hypothetical protein
MTDVVFIGKLYNADLSIGGGPIYPGAQPPGYWGGVAPPYPDQGLPGSQPRPSHPIAPGGRPPGYWGGVAPPYPDQGLPGAPPGYWGGVAPPYPDHGLPGLPPGTPTHPIELPEPLPPPPAEIADKYVAAVWNPTTDTWKVSVSDTAPAPQG